MFLLQFLTSNLILQEKHNKNSSGEDLLNQVRFNAQQPKFVELRLSNWRAI